MKKPFLFIVLALFSIMLLGQEQVPVQTEEQPQEQSHVQAAEQPPVLQLQGRDLKRIRFPEAFIHADKEYPAGDYWLVLATKDGQPFFAVQNAQKELLFEDLAVVKARSGGRMGSAFRVEKKILIGNEYFRVKVTTQGEWLMGYFLVKK
jgi:hypothetical protein